MAVPLSDEIRTALTAMQTRLKVTDANVRWVAPEAFHLTVAFLGDREASLRAPIEEACAKVVSQNSPFRVEVRGGSTFPKRGPGPLKTLWVGVSEGASAWKILARQAEESLAVFGVPPGNELVPHITLGRVKSEQNMTALRAAVAAEADTNCGAQIADRITLIQSFLNPDGATYQEVCSWPLGNDSSNSYGI